MRIIAFILDRSVIERILEHIGEPTTPPAVLPARAPPQAEMDFDQVGGAGEWPEMDQTLRTVGHALAGPDLHERDRFRHIHGSDSGGRVDQGQSAW